MTSSIDAELCGQLIRDGNHTVADLMSIGKTMLGRRHVLPSVVSTLTEIQVEGTFPTGTYLVTVHHPVSSDDGDLEKALYGSFLPVPSKDAFPLPEASEYESTKMPGAVVPVKEGKIVLNEGRKRIELKVTSKGDRPIQVMMISLSLADGLPRLMIRRSVRTTTLSRRILNSRLTAPERMAIGSTSPRERRSVLSLATPRPSLSSRLADTKPFRAGTTWPRALWTCLARTKSCRNYNKPDSRTFRSRWETGDTSTSPQ